MKNFIGGSIVTAIFIVGLAVLALAFGSFTKLSKPKIERFILACQKDQNVVNIMKRRKETSIATEACPALTLTAVCANSMWDFDGIWSGDRQRAFEDMDRHLFDNLRNCELSCDDGDPKGCAMIGLTMDHARLIGDETYFEIERWRRKKYAIDNFNHACENGLALACEESAIRGQALWEPALARKLSQCRPNLAAKKCIELKAFHEQLVAEALVYTTQSRRPLEMAKKGCELGSLHACEIEQRIYDKFPEVTEAKSTN